MPDPNGLPTDVECIAKLRSIPDVDMDGNLPLLQDVDRIRRAVIAHFQSPQGQDGKGGANRHLAPITEMRAFDGSGHSHLRVDDIVPGSSITVMANNITLGDVALSNEFQGMGQNELVRSAFTTQGVSYPYFFSGRSRIFPRGRQNIQVTTTWGYAATAPDDIYEALRNEVAYRALVQGVSGINGTGEEVELGDFKISTAVGAMNWRLSSPIGMMHDDYVACVNRHRAETVRMSGRHTRKMY